MNEDKDILTVIGGSLAGQQFTVTANGLRLGRSQSCEIAVSDPALSRNHCLIELRGDGVWVTDLASANGTQVNGEELTTQPRKLNSGDVIAAGDTKLCYIHIGAVPAEAKTTEPSVAAASVPAQNVDLGLGHKKMVLPSNSDNEVVKVKSSWSRWILWLVAIAAVAVSAWLILEPQGASFVKNVTKAKISDGLVFAEFECVKADANRIHRYHWEVNGDGEMAVSIDEAPSADRAALREKKKLPADSFKRLCKLLEESQVYTLEAENSATAEIPGVYNSTSFKIIRGTGVFSTVSENAPEPEVLRELRQHIEEFAKNELGIWAVEKSADELKVLAADTIRTADQKWDERDAQFGNLNQAIKLYEEAVSSLATVNPKPADYEMLLSKRDEARRELDRRYRDQRFLADRAARIGDWEAACRELRVLLEMIPDASDSRHGEIAKALLEAEARMKK